MRRQLIGALVVGLLLVGASPAHADAARLPDTAPKITYGTTYYGNSGPTDTDPGTVEFWDLGGFMVGSEIVIEATSDRPDGGPVQLCITQAFDSNWNTPEGTCNVAAPQLVTAAGGQLTFVPRYSDYEARLVFGNSENTGAYHFKVVAQRLKLSLEWFTTKGRIARGATLREWVSLTEREYSAPKGTRVTVVFTKGTRSWTRSGVTMRKQGMVSIPVRLPKAALGRVTLSVTASRDGYVDATPVSGRVRIVR